MQNQFNKNQVDLAYLLGVFNVSGLNGLRNEINRLEKLGKTPSQIISEQTTINSDFQSFSQAIRRFKHV